MRLVRPENRSTRLGRGAPRKALRFGRLVSYFAVSYFTLGCSFGDIEGRGDVGEEPGEPAPVDTEPEPADTPPADPIDTPGDAIDPPPPAEPESPQEALALAILENNCGDCHGAAGVSGIDYITNREALIANGQIVAGNPDESRLYNLMVEERMPPVSVTQRPTASEIEIVRQWIEGLGEVLACTHDGGFVSVDQVYATMLQDLLRQPVEDRSFTRYLGVVNAYNSGACGTALQREQYALLKTVNSVSTEARIVQPEPIDSRGLVYRVDIRDYGWDRAVEVQPGDTVIQVIDGVATAVNADPSPPIAFTDAWEAILSFSAPYAVELEGDDADRLKQEARTRVPFLQADAFIAAATTQNLYYTLIDAPETLGELFVQLGVDQQDQIERGIAKRAGFSTSGVSKQERSVMRFETNQPRGFFWTSADFADNGLRNVSIYAEPLAADAQAAGGEFIYSLPNGMMGFYVAANDGVGSRLTEAPTDVVVDPGQVKNNKAVTNGVSCNSCHQWGIFPFNDRVREWVLANQLDYDGETYETVLELYPTNEDMAEIVDADSEYFLSSLRASGVPTNLTDPVTRVHRDFVAKQVQKERAAGDLGVPVTLLEREMSRLDPRLRNVLRQGIDRELFDVLYFDSLCTLQVSARNRPVGCP